MITIPNTLQEVFDIVSTHLLTQGKKSIVNGIHCRYLSPGPDKLKCAAGILIPEDQYDPNFEGRPWQDIVKSGKAESKHWDKITDLQGIHDWTNPENWKFELKTFAEQNKLNHSIQV